MEIDDYIVASDATLVDLASAGDQQAFEYLFTRYRDALMRLFEQRLEEKTMASDLLQETFIRYICISTTTRRAIRLVSGYTLLLVTRLWIICVGKVEMCCLMSVFEHLLQQHHRQRSR